MSTKRLLFALLCAGAVGFGLGVALRVDASAITATLGALCGVTAGASASAVITAVVFSYRQRQRRQYQHPTPYAYGQPPMIVVPPAISQLPPARWPVGDVDLFPANRRFTIVGDEYDE